jgi:hypothetical protein
MAYPSFVFKYTGTSKSPFRALAYSQPSFHRQQRTEATEKDTHYTDYSSVCFSETLVSTYETTRRQNRIHQHV